MNKKIALITFLVFLLFVGGGVVAVLALATSTGLALGGAASVTAVATAETPLRTQAGWIRNNSPWPVTITAIDVDDNGTPVAPLIYLSETATETEPVEGELPVWAAEPVTLPYTLEGGDIRFLGFSIAPGAGQIASFDTISVTFNGPLPFEFTTDYSDVAVAAAAADFPAELLATDPSENELSINNYVDVLRSALVGGDIARLQTVMGGEATEEEAVALRDTLVGFTPESPAASEPVTDDSRQWSVQFYATDPAVDGLPPLDLQWSDFRWTARLAS